MATLYEINAQIEAILDRLFTEVDEETGEVKPEILEELNQMQEERVSKLEAIGCFIKNLESDAKAIKEEIAVLKDRMEAKQKKADRLREYVANDILSNDEKKIETPRICFSFRTSEQVSITDEAKIPKEYLTEKVSIAPDKTAIKKAIKEGQIVEGCELIQKQNLQIK